MSSVDDTIKRQLAHEIAKTKVPIKFNHIKDYEQVDEGIYKVTLDEKYKIVEKLKKAMSTEFLVYSGARLPYLGEEIIMTEGQEDYRTPPVYGFSTVMNSVKGRKTESGSLKIIPSAFIVYNNKKEADKTDKMCALSMDEKVYGRKRN